MKKLLSIVVLLTGYSINSLAQGQVTLANNAATLILYTDETPIPVGSFFFQLYAGPQGSSLESLTPLFPISSVDSPGHIASVTIDVGVVPPGNIALFQVWAWQSSFATYQEAEIGGGIIGKSTAFLSSISPNVDPQPTPVNLAGKFMFGPVPVPVPEPSIWAMFALGGTVILISFRRHRQEFGQ